MVLVRSRRLNLVSSSEKVRQGISLHSDSPPAAFSTKKLAVDFAKSCGWSPKDVTAAVTRFSLVWVVGQGIGSDEIRLLRLDGSYVDAPHPGFY